MPKQLLRLYETRKSDDFNDQESASSIQNSELLSANSQEFLKYLLSQVKRIIHGNRLGHWHSDPADLADNDLSLLGLYDLIETGIVIRVDLLDNHTDYIVIGDTAIDRKIELDYCYEMPIADRAITGTFVFNHNGVTVDLSNDYSFIEPEPSGVEFSADISGTEIRLKIVTKDVGENPTIKYMKKTIGIVD